MKDQEQKNRAEALAYAVSNNRDRIPFESQQTLAEVLVTAEKYLEFLQGDTKAGE